MNNLVFKGQNNQALTNSLLVAEKFGKEHSDVLKAIDALYCKMAENQCKGYFEGTSIQSKHVIKHIYLSNRNAIGLNNTHEIACL